MHKVNEIFETTEYDIFKFLKTYRDVKERFIQKLKQSPKKEDFIKVNT